MLQDFSKVSQNYGTFCIYSCIYTHIEPRARGKRRRKVKARVHAVFGCVWEICRGCTQQQQTQKYSIESQKHKQTFYVAHPLEKMSKNVDFSF